MKGEIVTVFRLENSRAPITLSAVKAYIEKNLRVLCTQVQVVGEPQLHQESGDFLVPVRSSDGMFEVMSVTALGFWADLPDLVKSHVTHALPKYDHEERT